ncbi:MAG TPA: hypothetical protein VMW63_04145 [Methanoregulaceae archaeon]|nr:hypothetical protein [Methanoregulaceae archaeon]
MKRKIKNQDCEKTNVLHLGKVHPDKYRTGLSFGRIRDAPDPDMIIPQ